MTLLIYKENKLYSDRVIWDVGLERIYLKDFNKTILGKYIKCNFAGDCSFKNILEDLILKFETDYSQSEFDSLSTRSFFLKMSQYLTQEKVLRDSVYFDVSGYIYANNKVYFYTIEKNKLYYYEINQKYDSTGSSSDIALTLLDLNMDVQLIYKTIAQRDPKVGIDLDIISLI